MHCSKSQCNLQFIAKLGWCLEFIHITVVGPHITFHNIMLHYIILHYIILHYIGIYSHYSQVVVLLAPHRGGMHCHLPYPTLTYPHLPAGISTLEPGYLYWYTPVPSQVYAGTLSIYLYCYRKFHLKYLRYLVRILPSSHQPTCK